MAKDELIREIQLKRQLSELDGSPVPEYDPSDGMETVEELKRYVRFLYSSLQEKDRENRQVRDEMAEIKAELKAANRRADSESESRRRLFDKLERFMDSQKEADDEKKNSFVRLRLSKTAWHWLTKHSMVEGRLAARSIPARRARASMTAVTILTERRSRFPKVLPARLASRILLKKTLQSQRRLKVERRMLKTRFKTIEQAKPVTMVRAARAVLT